MKELEEKYVQNQLLKGEVEELLKQKEIIEQKIFELNMTKNTIGEISKIKKGDFIWAPIGSDVFVSARIEDNKTFLSRVGADVSVKKTGQDVIKILDRQIKELNNSINQINITVGKYVQELKKIEDEIIRLRKKNS